MADGLTVIATCSLPHALTSTMRRTITLFLIPVFIWTSSLQCTRALFVAKNHTLSAAEGTNLTLHCEGQEEATKGIYWTWGPAVNHGKMGSRFVPKSNGDLVIFDLRKEDAQLFSCQDAESNESIHSVLLQVTSIPPAVTNLSVIPKSVYALVTWSSMIEDGGYPITSFHLSYRRDKSHLSEKDDIARSLSDDPDPFEWRMISDISPNATSYTIYKLSPNSTYYFRICAVNRLGCGQNVSTMADTLFIEEEVEAAKELINVEESNGNASGSSKPVIKIWIMAIVAFFITFAIIGLGISLLFFKHWDQRRSVVSSCESTEEVLELVPHITLNPSFNIEMLEYIDPNDIQQSPPNPNRIRPIIRNGGANQISNRISPDDPQQLLVDVNDELNLVNSPLKRKAASDHTHGEEYGRLVNFNDFDQDEMG